MQGLKDHYLSIFWNLTEMKQIASKMSSCSVKVGKL